MPTPRNAGLRPALMSSMTGLADEMGIAKPTFCAGCDPVPDATAVLMPMTHPFASTSGPPELPGLMAGTGRPGDDPVGHAEPSLERERVADRHDVVADLHLVRIVGAHHREIAGVDLENGDVGARVGSHDARVERAAVVELELGALRGADDVGVRRQVAVRREEEARPGALAAALVDRDGDDGGLDLGDDAGDVAVATDRRRLARDLVRLGRRRSRRAVVVAAEREVRPRCDERAAQAADERADEELAETLRALGGRGRRAGRRRDGGRLRRPGRRGRGDGQDVRRGNGLIRHQSVSDWGRSCVAISNAAGAVEGS